MCRWLHKRCDVLALIAVYLACFCEWDDSLSLGERGTLLIVATDKRQAKVIFRYIIGLLTSVPTLAEMIVRETNEIIELSNGIATTYARSSRVKHGVRRYLQRRRWSLQSARLSRQNAKRARSLRWFLCPAYQ
jgi:hypothetical protein